MERAFQEYITDVKEPEFPAAEHSNSMDPQALRDLIRQINFLDRELEQSENSETRYQ